MSCVFLFAGLLLGAEPEPLRIRATEDAARIEVIAALPEKALAPLPKGKLSAEQGERLLRLTLLDADSGKEGPAILGSYERRNDNLVFTPCFPLTPGQRYRATLEVPGSKPLTTEYRVPERKAAAAAVVEQVYPTAAVLPANQLKFYIHFSKPMAEGREIFDRIKLLDAAGKEIAEPWRRTELWSADGRRLTLWIHPGRIKQGVALREQEGPVLEPNKEYTLLIGAELLDTEGRRLAKAFRKKFRTGLEEHTRPLPEQWRVRPPVAGERSPLIVEFPRPLDRALLDRFVTVLDADGQPVAGRIEVGAEERSWSFHPERPWRAAEYRIKVEGELEDLAGNTPLRPFDVDLKAPSPAPPKLNLPFRPRLSSDDSR
jgi:hypothetical protein